VTVSHSFIGAVLPAVNAAPVPASISSAGTGQFHDELIMGQHREDRSVDLQSRRPEASTTAGLGHRDTGMVGDVLHQVREALCRRSDGSRGVRRWGLGLRAGTGSTRRGRDRFAGRDGGSALYPRRQQGVGRDARWRDDDERCK